VDGCPLIEELPWSWEDVDGCPLIEELPWSCEAEEGLDAEDDCDDGLVEDEVPWASAKPESDRMAAASTVFWNFM
jgi:hypothetical protein